MNEQEEPGHSDDGEDSKAYGDASDFVYLIGEPHKPDERKGVQAHTRDMVKQEGFPRHKPTELNLEVGLGFR